MTRGITEAPFTDETADLIERYQNSVKYHPLTCPRRGEAPHKSHGHPAGDFGVLALDSLMHGGYGLVCPDCGYTQHWVPDVVIKVMEAEEIDDAPEESNSY